MGIDFSHCDAHWSYGGFNDFRLRLAKKIGIDLDEMQGFKMDGSKGIPWDTVNDPIKPLLDHSDCDGILTPEECKAVAPRLRELVSDWTDGSYHKTHAIELADGMDAAAKEGVPLEFQ